MKRFILIIYILFINNCLHSQDMNVIELNDFPAGVSYDGEIIESIQWKDKLGLHYLIITYESTGSFFGPNWKAILRGYEYLVTKDKVDLVWDIIDYSTNPYTNVLFVSNSLRISDLNNDGICESMFIYVINPDGLDPAKAKLIFHNHSDKLAIRGLLPKIKDDDKLYEKNVDNAFKSNKNEFLVEASNYWDKFYNYYKLTFW